MQAEISKKRLNRAREVLETEILGLKTVRDRLGAEFAELVGLCLRTLGRNGKIVLSGIGKSGHVGHKIAATLASTGSPAAFLHPVEAMHGDLGMLGENDLLLALSYSGETDELLAMLPAVRRIGVPVAAITGVPGSRLAELSDLVVPMTVPREACPFNLAPTATSTALMALGDALAMVLLEERGFEQDDYARLHPAGAIGRSITLRVRDVMRTGERFPRVGPETPVRDALAAMTRARAGSVAVIDARDKLLGIFTDGDFRRRIVRDAALLTRPIREVMTPQPVTVRDSDLAVEILKTVETRRIDDLLVVDSDGRAVGLVDSQDLPRFKLM